MPCHWRATPTEHSIPSGAEGMSVRITGCSWKQGNLPSLADDILIKFSSLRSAPDSFSGQGFILGRSCSRLPTQSTAAGRPQPPAKKGLELHGSQEA